jgi:hypothetical protein
LTGLTFDADPAATQLVLDLGLERYGQLTKAVDIHFDNVVLRLL